MKLYLLNSIRTNNFHDEQVMGKISAMWEEASRQLENYQHSIYGVYYAYDSDYKGDYSLSVAVEHHDGGSLIEIPDDRKYEVFKVDTADEQGIFKTWSRIWKLEEAGSLKRAYTYDYEKYNPNGEVEIHIAIT